MIYNYHYN